MEEKEEGKEEGGKQEDHDEEEHATRENQGNSILQWKVAEHMLRLEARSMATKVTKKKKQKKEKEKEKQSC